MLIEKHCVHPIDLDERRVSERLVQVRAKRLPDGRRKRRPAVPSQQQIGSYAGTRGASSSSSITQPVGPQRQLRVMPELTHYIEHRAALVQQQ